MPSDEIDMPTSHCFLTQLPKVQALVKIVLKKKFLQFYPIRRLVLLISEEHDQIFVLICFQLANDVYTWR